MAPFAGHVLAAVVVMVGVDFEFHGRGGEVVLGEVTRQTYKVGVSSL